MKSFLNFLVLFLMLHCFGFAQSKLQTTAEKSNYESTSTFDEVIQYINNLEESSDQLRIESMATSAAGRDVPLMIIADPLPASYQDIKDDDRIVTHRV